MNNSNFGYDCRNNIDNCKFAPIFDEYNEITFVSRYHNVFDQKVSQFVTSDSLKRQIEEKFNAKLIIKIDFMKLNYKQLNQKDLLQTIKSERLSSLEVAEKVDQNKKNK